jgi:primosomal protein N' (replication factor Y)
VGAYRSGRRPPAALHLIAAVIPLVPVWRTDHTYDYAIPEELTDSVTVGSLVRVPFGHRKVRGIVARLDDASPDRSLESIASVVVEPAVAPPPLDGLIRWIAKRYAVPYAKAFARMTPPRVRVRIAPPVRLSGGPPADRISSYSGGRELIASIESGASDAWCLRALPGEDRGRLVAELVAAAGRAGEGACLVAVPEVRYGSRVLDELEGWWPELARVDSARRDSERAAGWLRLAGGHGIGAGGRATVLAPAPSVRLIVVDEEHHPSYKDDRSPRYDARRVAIERARRQGAVCVLISAAPSVETGAAARDGRFGYVDPGKQAARAARPIIEVVDPPTGHVLSHALHSRIRDALREDRRAALLVPARGYARALWCTACRRSVRCPMCEAGVFVERARQQVRCGRCGWSARAPDACPACGARDLRYIGAGSERVAEQVSAAFPKARVRRVDPDALAEGPPAGAGADIYVTTWIGTKASIRPPVGLVGVLDADGLLRRPDFRAAEHGYQALVELAEWVGPASEGGRLVIQSSEPTHHALQALARADYGYFLERELHHRAELGYPPFSELVKVTATGPQGRRLIEEAAGVCRGQGATVLGPIEAFRGARGGLELLAKCADATSVAVALRELLGSVPGGNRLIVDVDPR